MLSCDQRVVLLFPARAGAQLHIRIRLSSTDRRQRKPQTAKSAKLEPSTPRNSTLQNLLP